MKMKKAVHSATDSGLGSYDNYFCTRHNEPFSEKI